MKNHKNRGFSFIEILLVVSILSVISLGLYNTFSSGLKIWERSRRSVVEEDIVIFFDKLERELHNAFNYSQLKFDGRESAMAFTTLVHTKPDAASSFEQDDFIDQIGRVKYYFDYGKGNLLRRQANYGQALKEKFQKEQPIVRAINSVRFRYYYEMVNGYGFKPEGNDDLPIGVRVDVEFKVGSELRSMTRYINIPVVS